MTESAYILELDEWKNEIFIKNFHVIIDEEYIIWYMSIT